LVLLKREGIGFLSNKKKEEEESWFSLLDIKDKQSLVFQFEKTNGGDTSYTGENTYVAS